MFGTDAGVNGRCTDPSYAQALVPPSLGSLTCYETRTKTFKQNSVTSL